MLVRALTKVESHGTEALDASSTEEMPVSALVVNTGGIREGMLEGDFEKGTVSISIASALINEIKPVRDIIKDLVE